MSRWSARRFAMVAGISACVLVAALSELSVHAAEPLVMNAVLTPPLNTEDQTGFVDRVAKLAFDRAGIGLRIVPTPPQRSVYNLQRGIDDGSLARVRAIQRLIPDAVRVPEPIYTGSIVAVSKRRDIRVKGWSSLNSYSIAYPRGWKIVEKNLSAARRLFKVAETKQMIDMLVNDRVEVIIAGRLPIMFQLRRLGVTQAKVLEPSLVSGKLFIFLHKRHAAKAAPLEAALKSLKADGTYDRLLAELRMSLEPK